jgi:DNA-binding NarL/FixJ family response regulator
VTLRVLIADDHRLMVDGVRAALEAADGIEVVAEAYSGADVLPLVHQTRPDLVLLDLRMPELDGLTCLERLQKQYPDVKVIVLSVYNDREHIERALKRGACGYIVKSVNPIDLPSAIRQAFEGSVFHAVGIGEADGDNATRDAGLTEREVVILKAVGRGLSNHAIGKELWVTEQTVKFHLTNIYRKLGVGNRTEAANYAFRHGLVETAVDRA